MNTAFRPIMTKSVIKGHDIGNYTFGEPSIVGQGNLFVGNFTIFSENVCLAFLDHSRNELATAYPFRDLFPDIKMQQALPTKPAEIHIGHDVLIGSNVTVLAGANIGNGAIVSDGSVISGEIAPYSIVAGNPATLVAMRFAEEWIDALQRRVQWWDWPIDLILERAEGLLQPPGKHLFAYFKPKK